MARRRRLLDLIENPSPEEEQRILDWEAEGVTLVEIARRTGYARKTITRTLQKHGRGKKAKVRDPEQEAKILELAKVPGITVGAISRKLGALPAQTIRDTLARHKVSLALAPTIKKRIEEAVEAKVAPGEVISRELKLEIAKSEVEFFWAVAASKMLLLPAQELPQDERLKRLQKLLSEGLTKVQALSIDGRSMSVELRDVAAFVMKMILGASPEEYQKRYKRGGVEAMLKYGEKVAAKQAPIESQAVSDFIALATLHAETPGVERKGLQKLAEEYEDYLERGMDPEAAGAAEFRAELKQIKKLKRLSGDPEKFLAALEEEREKVAHMTGPMRDLAKVELRKLARQIIPPALWESVPKMRAYAMTQTLREQARELYEAEGVEATPQVIDQVLLAMDVDFTTWPGGKKPRGWPRPTKPVSPRAREAPAKWLAYMQEIAESGPGRVLPPEPVAAPVAPPMGFAHVPKKRRKAERAPLAEREMKLTGAPRFRLRRERPVERKLTQKQRKALAAERAREKLRERERAKRISESEQAAMAAEYERRERMAYDLLERDVPHSQIEARTGIHITDRTAAQILNKWRKRLKIKKRKIKEPKAKGGLWATVYALLVAKATPEEIEEMTGTYFPQESGVYGQRDPISGRQKQVEMTGLNEIRQRMKKRGVVKDFMEKVKKDLKLHRKIKAERERRALEKAAELAAMEEAKATGNPPWTWGDRLFVRVNAALVTGAPLKRRPPRKETRRATRRNPNKGSIMRRLMRL